MEAKVGDPKRRFPGNSKNCGDAATLLDMLLAPSLSLSLSPVFGCITANLMWEPRVQSAWVQISVMNTIPITKLALYKDTG